MTDKAKIMALAEDCEERAVEKASFTSSYACSLDNLLQARAALKAAIDELVRERDDFEWKATHREEMFNQRQQLIRDIQSTAMAMEKRAEKAEAAIDHIVDANKKVDQEARKLLEEVLYYIGDLSYSAAARILSDRIDAFLAKEQT